MRRRRMRYQPSKWQSIFSGVVGVIFCLIGVVLVIPSFGPFGLFWTGIALVITVSSFAAAAGKGSMMGSYVIDEEELEEEPVDRGEPQSAEERLRELQKLYDSSLITAEEYEEKRRRILEEL